MNAVPPYEEKVDRCILLLVKYPRKEHVKQRLAASLADDVVVELYRNFVLDTLAMLEKLPLPFFICFSPHTAQKKFSSWLGTKYRFLPQVGADLGKRMRSCFDRAFAFGFTRVLLIGSDSPDLPGAYLREAFAALETHEVVLGPASDGGYYLIGFRDTSFTPSVFEEIHWSTPTVFEETLGKIQKASRTVGLLPVWSDVDTIADLRALVTRSENTAFKSSRTITYLRQHAINLGNPNGA